MCEKVCFLSEMCEINSRWVIFILYECKATNEVGEFEVVQNLFWKFGMSNNQYEIEDHNNDTNMDNEPKFGDT